MERMTQPAKKIILSLTFLLAASSMPITAVAASPHQSDYFGRSTNSSAATPSPVPRASVSPQAPVYNENVNGKKWFEFFDDAVFAHQPTDKERVILTKPFNQDAQRVIEWTNTAAKVARQYRELARNIRATRVPGCLAPSPGDTITVEDFKNQTADWYDDSAAIFEEYIRPRKPAKTVEELDETLLRVHERSQALTANKAALDTMDKSLREHFNLPLNLHEDAVQKYARKKLPAHP